MSVSRLLPLNWFLKARPLTSFLISWCIGIVLTAGSYLLGFGNFKADVMLLMSNGQSRHLSLDLGYAQQLNYGPWYTIPFFCPFVFCLCSFLYSVTTRLTPERHSTFCNFETLTRHRSVTALGGVIFVFFTFHNVIVEARDYRNLAFGWVQAETLEREGHDARIKHAAVEIRRRFYTFDDNNSLVQADAVLLEGVAPPTFHVRSHSLFLAFIICSKLWVGLWQGLVVYVSLLLCYWGIGVVSAIEHNLDIADSDSLAKLGIKWARPVVVVGLLIGLEGNIFSLGRFVANAAKGSFGSWDQYFSTVVLAPPVILGVTSVVIIGKVLSVDSFKLDSVATKLELLCWASWAGTAGMLVHLLIGFNDPFTNNLISIATSVTTNKIN